MVKNPPIAVAASSSRDLHLLQEYLRACRHSGGIVLALGDDIVMLNDNARLALSPADQAALITRATDMLAVPGGAASGAVTADLPSGTVVRLSCRRVSGDGSCPDGVVHVKIVASASGATSVVALVSGKKIRALRLSVVANGAVNVKFQSNSTDITGRWFLTQFASGGGGYCPVGLFETAVGEALNINLSASVSVEGILTCIEV